MNIEKTLEEIKRLFDLTGKVAIITGGSGGFGRAVSIGLAAHGADVVLTSRTLSSLEEVAHEIRKLGKKALPISCDVTDPKSVDSVVHQTVEEFGRVNILITGAGIAMRSPAEEMSIEDWQKVMEVNVKGTFLCCQAVGRVMIKQGGGKIITVSSVRGLLGHPGGYSAYGTSKGAIHLLTRQLACEWAKYRINVNSIAPNIFRTALTESILKDEKMYNLFLSRIPWGRLAEPEDFIGASVFLASGASEFVTGQILYVDGGSVAG